MKKIFDIIGDVLGLFSIGAIAASFLMCGLNQLAEFQLKKYQRDSLILQNHIYQHELVTFYNCEAMDSIDE